MGTVAGLMDLDQTKPVPHEAERMIQGLSLQEKVLWRVLCWVWEQASGAPAHTNKDSSLPEREHAPPWTDYRE